MWRSTSNDEKVLTLQTAHATKHSTGGLHGPRPPPSQGEQNLSQRPTPCFALFTARGTHGAGSVPQEAAVEVPLQILLARPKAPGLGLSF